jgi:hypothetical protein
VDEGIPRGTLSEAENSREGEGDTLLNTDERKRNKVFTMKFVQINLHHSKAATVVLSWKLAMGKDDIALIQAPRVQGGQVRVIRGHWGTFSGTQCNVKILHLCKEQH